MTEQKKQIKKNPHPLVVKGTFFVTAVFEDKAYVVSNGVSFLYFITKKSPELAKGDYVEIHGPIYKKKGASNVIVTGEAIVRKLDEKEVEKYKAELDAVFKTDPLYAINLKNAPANIEKAAGKSTENKLPWE